MLNTDMHIADMDQKMSRGQFIKNTLPTLRHVVESVPGAFQAPGARGSMLPPPRPSANDVTSETMKALISRDSNDGGRPTYRLSARPSNQSAPEESWHKYYPVPLDFGPSPPFDNCGPLVKAPFQGKLSAWETQVESVLKDFYNSIRQQSLPLSGSDRIHRASVSQAPPTSMSNMSSGMLRRSPSMLSKNSDNPTVRGRLMNSALGSRWSSKTRSRNKLYAPSLGGMSMTSLDDDMSGTSPAASSMWSKYSWGRTQGSMLSFNSFGSEKPQADYNQSIGFANALSQAIIREGEDNTAEGDEQCLRAAPLLEDESLELAGAPWAKEGTLKHKHHLEGTEKKIKGRDWAECFAVIEKGYLRIFQFNSQKTLRNKSKALKPGDVVGGGNWMDNAESLGKFLLRHTIASALPPPGYSKSRPHVWALSLPTGAVHLFQAGTPEIVKEYVSTANYWSARLSKEPLIGGVSNVEYGWSDAVINTALISERGQYGHSHSPSIMSVAAHRPSLQGSLRSSFDQGGSGMRPKLPGDRITITDWAPPPQSMMASNLMEVDQLKALTTYVGSVKAELEKHNELRPAMLLAFSPRQPNHTRAMANFEKKSSYLLREIVKFSTYAECLSVAEVAKKRIEQERRERGDVPRKRVVHEKGIEVGTSGEVEVEVEGEEDESEAEGPAITT